MHLQDHRRKVGAVDLRLGELGPGEEVFFGIKPDRDAGADPATAPRSLVGRCLRDLFDWQALQATAMAVAADARMAGVDHRANAGHRQRSLGYIGCQRQKASPAIPRPCNARP
jgi:hypothetical protein